MMRATGGSNTPLQDWLATLEATLAYGVSRQTLLQRVKRGELQAVHVRSGRGKGLRIQPSNPQDACFDHRPQRVRTANQPTSTTDLTPWSRHRNGPTPNEPYPSGRAAFTPPGPARRASPKSCAHRTRPSHGAASSTLRFPACVAFLRKRTLLIWPG